MDIQVNTDYDKASYLSLRIFGNHYRVLSIFFLYYARCLQSHRFSRTVERVLRSYYDNHTPLTLNNNCHLYIFDVLLNVGLTEESLEPTPR